MSSIDKYVRSEAQSLDHRVQVRKVNGVIIGTIGGTTVFRITDRFGYLSDSERSIIRRGINSYNQAEIQRRKEEEERRRKEEEERRRRLEEERKRNLQRAKDNIAAKESAVNTLKARASVKSESISVPPEIEEYLDVRSLVANASSEVSKTSEEFSKYVEGYCASLIKQLRSNLAALPSDATNETIEKIERSTARINPKLDTSSFENKNKEIIATVRNVLVKANEVVKKLKAVKEKYAGVEIDSLLTRIKNMKITSANDLNVILQMIESTLEFIKDEEDRKVFNELLDELRTSCDELSSLELTSDVHVGDKYETYDFNEEIQNSKDKILALRQKILSRGYSTISASLEDEIEEFLSSEEVGKNEHEKASKLLSSLERVNFDDEKLKVNYEAFKEAVEDASKEGVIFNEEFDPQEPEAQLERIVNAIIDHENEEVRRTVDQKSLLILGVIQQEGFEVIDVEDSQDSTTMIFARKDMKGVVLAVDITEEGYHSRLIGVKMDDKTSSVDEIINAAKIIEAENIPTKMMEALVQVDEDAGVGEDIGFSTTEGIKEKLQYSEVYDLDENQEKREAYVKIVGEEEIKQVKTEKSTKRHSVKVSVAAKAQERRSKKVKKQMARYMKR